MHQMNLGNFANQRKIFNLGYKEKNIESVDVF